MKKRTEKTPEKPVRAGPSQPGATGLAAPENESSLVEALRNREEAAFETLLDRYHAPLMRMATLYVPNRAVAEETVQETWLGVLQGLHRFEGRSSLKTWIFRILINRAKTRGQREARSIPFSVQWDKDTHPAEFAVEPDRFLAPTHPQWPDHWGSPPQSWGESPEDRLLSQETRAHLQQAIEALPPAQQEVITLRDVEGWTSEEVCNVLGLSGTNQRVLLHRARSGVRRALEAYFKQGRN